jgi:diguanylate cyclase (GGDEF)-like protein
MSASSSALVDHVVRLTEHRDRGLIDLALTRALMELLAPLKVAIVGVATEQDQTHWLPLTRQERGGAAEMLLDPLWVDFHKLERLEDLPHRFQCLMDEQRVEVMPDNDAEPHLNLFPLFMGAEEGADGQGVIEIFSEEKLSPQALQAVSSLQSVYRNMHGMLDYGERDALTGLLNRKSFDEAFYKALKDSRLELGDSMRASAPSDRPLAANRRPAPSVAYWLAMIDVDHFKRVNDVHGHPIGDEVLLLVARILKDTFRSLDRVYRFGGEEFMVLLRCPDDASAIQAMERFRVQMERYCFPQAGQITASVGLTHIQAEDSPTTARARADKALYYAKGSGRNKVCSHHDLVHQGLLQTDTKLSDVELF